MKKFNLKLLHGVSCQCNFQVIVWCTFVFVHLYKRVIIYNIGQRSYLGCDSGTNDPASISMLTMTGRIMNVCVVPLRIGSEWAYPTRGQEVTALTSHYRPNARETLDLGIQQVYHLHGRAISLSQVQIFTIYSHTIVLVYLAKHLQESHMEFNSTAIFATDSFMVWGSNREPCDSQLRPLTTRPRLHNGSWTDHEFVLKLKS